MNNTKLTCPTCGKWGYFDTSVKPVTCHFCGEDLDLIPPAPPRVGRQIDKFNRRWGSPEEGKPLLTAADSPSSQPRIPEAPPKDTQDRQYTGCWLAELGCLRRNQTPVTVFTTGGFRIRGTIASYERDAVVLLSDGVRKLIPRHAISTIQPIA